MRVSEQGNSVGHGVSDPSLTGVDSEGLALKVSFADQITRPFHSVDSMRFIPLPESVASVARNAASSAWAIGTAYLIRSEFDEAVQQGKWDSQPVFVSRSAFVPITMALHLMTNKRDSALGEKYVPGSRITNMEAALHTFVTAHLPVTMAGDYTFNTGHSAQFCSPGMGRKVILSTEIKPDFEFVGEDEVVMGIVGLKPEEIVGVDRLPGDGRPLWDQAHQDPEFFNECVPEYDAGLKQYMVYHLTSAHRLPSRDEVASQVISPQEAVNFLERQIEERTAIQPEMLRNTFVLVGYEEQENVISLEALFNIYIHQIRNEFLNLDRFIPQGYVYTMDPAMIFSRGIAGDYIGSPVATMLVRLQILACKHLKEQGFTFKNLRVIGFNDFADPTALSFFAKVFSGNVRCMSKQQALAEEMPGVAWILHNNSDGFGQNIESEGMSSLDGVIGCLSDASVHLRRERASQFLYTNSGC